MTIGGLHVLTDEVIQSRYNHVELARLAIDGGADLIQLRDKRRGARELIDIAQVVGDICHTAGVGFIVNDRVDIAMAVGADGVHVGARDLPVDVARRLLGREGLVGASASTVEDALAAERAGASYLGVGHVYATASKKKGSPPIGLDALARLREAVAIPVIAIGGITADNIRDVLATGVHGVAAIGAVCASNDPRAAVADLKRAITERRSSR